eukprot:CAMPEP_0178972356 /NCGR_PEP_ID=MMETSP0789-20121207/20954_1 /TAXON_ID=3005 /ORGANISM="Rhizosolenia setigera, Strain CCMP 1694" /LENGTH=53 /DNA_ID=CAMNT_0020659767 /DNA_START=30 /DNA_END=187 /DNA_ORIENTATION=+
MKLSLAAFVATVGTASAFSFFNGVSVKAPRSVSTLNMSTGMGVNGFGRIGRLV